MSKTNKNYDDRLDNASDDEIEEEEIVRPRRRFDEDLESIKTNKGPVQSYKYFESSKLKEGEEPFSRVIGHDNQKKELLNVVKWFKNSKELKKKGISIPKGCILNGAPGNGKSLLIKEIIRCADAPVFVFTGEDENICGGIIDIFRKARQTGHAIIVFDELDLLINKDRRVIRALQENLDGVESDDDILVLAATNDIDDIPGALLRNGRLEKIIYIPYPTNDEALALFKKHMNEFNVKTAEELDEDEISILLSHISCAGIKSIINDLVLRNGFEGITNDMVFDSICNITDRVKGGKLQKFYQVAVHEAGHAAVANLFEKYFYINRLNMDGAAGEFHVKEKEEDFKTYSKALAEIQISLAGNLAEKEIIGDGSIGCVSDLDRARTLAYNLVNVSGYRSCWRVLPPVYGHHRTETQEKRRGNEKEVEKILKKCERKTKRLIKQNKEKIIALGTRLFEKKFLKQSEILSILNN